MIYVFIDVGKKSILSKRILFKLFFTVLLVLLDTASVNRFLMTMKRSKSKNILLFALANMKRKLYQYPTQLIQNK